MTFFDYLQQPLDSGWFASWFKFTPRVRACDDDDDDESVFGNFLATNRQIN